MSEYVIVPRDALVSVLADAPTAGPAWDALHNALAAAPPVASVRARELDAAIEALEKAAADFALDATDDDTNNLQDAGCRLQNARDELRSLLAPVDEVAPVAGGWWCPHCKVAVPDRHVTNVETHDARAGGCGYGVTGAPLPESSEAPVAWIPKCDFDGMATGRVGRAFGPQPDLLKSRDNCVPVYTHPAPLPALAGVTELLTEAVNRLNELGYGTAAMHVNRAIADHEAALGARKGE